ncbi:MAG TPA: hypothetical protein VHT91_16150 [Kofleriaceae bacterium]|nr:hypothetical protein [Kofleriaceae bacterium]
MRASILMLGLVVGEVAAGCGFHSPARAAAGDGAGSDSGTDGDGGCSSFATLVDTCHLSFEADLIVNGPAKYDTDAHVLTIGGTTTPFAVTTVQIGADQVDVISAHDVHLAMSGSLRATGSHGLAIIASHDFLIDDDAQIDVSRGGAGARTSCPGGATSGEGSTNGAGGGGGGGFGDAGGNGGVGNHDGPKAQGGSRGKAEMSFPTGFHGGCPGADGGAGDLPGGAGGQAGGALYLVAAGRMVFTSSEPLDAGGDGGRGGAHGEGTGDAGGGGGGSGGLLILEALDIQASGATIAANGGGGGEGSDNDGGGGDGTRGALASDRAPGGSGGADQGSDGGDGGSEAGTDGLSVTANADGGGGGGGGGVGFIRLLAPNPVFGAVSPAPG